MMSVCICVFRVRDRQGHRQCTEVRLLDLELWEWARNLISKRERAGEIWYFLLSENSG
jgi:hypothetical protein